MRPVKCTMRACLKNTEQDKLVADVRVCENKVPWRPPHFTFTVVVGQSEALRGEVRQAMGMG
jgi:hypothetical protein